MATRTPSTIRRRSAFHPPAGRRDAGAAAVEFALVSPVLFLMLFGIVDYGLYFADVVSVQQGVANAARAATLSTDASGNPVWASSACPAPTTGVSLSEVTCGVTTTVKPLTGKVYVKAQLVMPSPGTSGAVPAPAWTVGARLRLCTITSQSGLAPFVPLPNGGVIHTRVDMPVQAASTAPILMPPVADDVSGVPADWSWC